MALAEYITHVEAPIDSSNRSTQFTDHATLHDDLVRITLSRENEEWATNGHRRAPSVDAGSIPSIPGDRPPST
jgi:hypothetical protein